MSEHGFVASLRLALAWAVAWCCFCAGRVVADAPNRGGASGSLLTKAQAVVEWLESSHPGSFDSRQELRTIGDSAGIGVFANQPIEEGQVLVEIPQRLVLRDRVGSVSNLDDTKPRDLSCSAVRGLLNELRRGSSSRFAPWMEYLLAVPLPSIPSAWSNGGKQLFDELTTGTTVFKPLPPLDATSWLDRDWVVGCGGTRSLLEDRAVLLHLSRSDQHNMVPVYDLYNHHPSPNVGVRIQNHGTYTLYASRAINTDEQLHISYTDCPHCEREEDYGTADIFRDYGFVEDYPQRWLFYFDDTGRDRNLVEIDLNHNRTDASDAKYTVLWTTGIDDVEAHWMMKDYLSHFGRWRSDELHAGPEAWAAARGYSVKQFIPQHEWDATVNYVDAAIIALTNILVSVRGSVTSEAHMYRCLNEVDETCLRTELYPTLGRSPSIQSYRRETCEFQKILNIPHYRLVETIQSEYQEISFIKSIADDETNGNMCMKLDHIYQICDNFRPHYHEFAVHYPARYLKQVQRVAFIGGGDSMILHEVLKYPDLELVLGLELDQTVVRNSFKHFHTQPHFDDDRVEWWFGDATKSLMLLPKEYLTTFDLVIVDVSETGASLAVTEHLDILNAMALLVKKDGIMVKNEPYFKQMSGVFDFTVDVHFYHCPMICDQSMIMGSNGIDFYRYSNLTDHGIDNMILPNIEDYPELHYLWRDYSVNSPVMDGSCAKIQKAIEKQDESDGIRHGKSEGIIMIIELEKCNVDMDNTEDILIATLTSLGFTLVVPDEHNTNVSFEIVVVMSEGYVVARLSQSMSYIAFDIHLWGRFDLMDDTRKAIIEKFEQESDVATPSFRIVVSGMYDNSSWEDDKQRMGPDLRASTRSCGQEMLSGVEDADALMKDKSEADSETIPGTEPLDTMGSDAESPANWTTRRDSGTVLTKDVQSVALSAIVENIAAADSLILVFCGLSESECTAATVLQESLGPERVLALHTCLGLETMDFGDPDEDPDLTGVHECRQSLALQIKETLSRGSKPIDGAILDAQAPYAMARIYTSFWTFRRTLFQNSVVHLYAALAADDSIESWRPQSIFVLQKRLDIDPLTRTELLLTARSDNLDLPFASISILTVDTPLSFSKIRASQAAIERPFGDVLDVWPAVMEGGTLMHFDMDEMEFQHFRQSDYDLSGGMQQYAQQYALSRQTIFQLVRDEGSDGDEHDGGYGRGSDVVKSSPNMDAIISMALSNIGIAVESSSTHANVGSGNVVVIRFKDGHVIGTWDGRNHIVLNLYRSDQRRASADAFFAEYLSIAGAEGWKQELRDDFPRGIRGVVNFKDESK